jgi:Fe2+ or Zn2+ uptake regulation protein
MADTRADLLLEAMRRAGLRLTLARRAICRVLGDSKEDFLTAATILERVTRIAGVIDPSTVYRTLDDLARLGYLHHVHLGSLPGAWHVTVDHNHQHLVCEGCGRTITVPLAELAPGFDVIKDRYRFRPNAHHFAILGYCENCSPPADHPHG